MPAVSVVIPTFNRLDVLPEVLAALSKQEGAPDFEVIVIDDGSTDGTAGWLETFRAPFAFRFERRDNGGPAGARNHGVRLATGRRVAFLGDDTVPEPGWLRAHEDRSQSAGAGPIAVIGYTGWHRRLRRNTFLDYINEHGLQFGYALIEDPDDVPFNFFYTSNLSLPRDLLVREPFDEGFPYPAWEDIEAAYRMTRRHGLRLAYAPEARTAHDHPTNLARFQIRQEKAGFCAVVFYQRHPELGPFLGLSPEGPPALPSAFLQRLREGLARALQHLPLRTAGLWEELLRYHYIRGLQRGWRERIGDDLAPERSQEGEVRCKETG